MLTKIDQKFIQQLQAQAIKQAPLDQHRVLPKQLDVVTIFIGNYPWQVIAVFAGLTAAILSI